MDIQPYTKQGAYVMNQKTIWNDVFGRGKPMQVSKITRRCVHFVTVFAVLIASISVTPKTVEARPIAVSAASGSGGLFRTKVVLSRPTDRARLDKLGVKVLTETANDAIVLADDVQLETLARLRFEPQASDDLYNMAVSQADSKPWLASGLQPLFGKVATLQQAQRNLLSTEMKSPLLAASVDTARQSVQASIKLLSPEQVAGITTLVGVDSDGDGLTDTQESWWCTDPLNTDSDMDGASDGVEVQQAKDWLGNKRATYPQTGKPFAGWPMKPGDGNFNPACQDSDYDGVPDNAETWELGLNRNIESTDRDKFDDGQELFGITPPNWGTLPRPEDVNFIGTDMPAWVKAPGNHPFVAAYPIPTISVVPSSFVVKAVTTVTTERTVSDSEEHSYSTSATKGTSTSLADTVTWNGWDEQSVAKTTPVYATRVLNPEFQGLNHQRLSPSGDWENVGLFGDIAMTVIGTAAGIACGVSVVCGVAVGAGTILVAAGKVIGDAYLSEEKTKLDEKTKEVENQVLENKLWRAANHCTETCSNKVGTQPNTEQDIAGQQSSADTQDRSIGDRQRGGVTTDSQVYAQQIIQMSYPVQRPTVTQASSHGTSRGGEQTTTHNQYEENTVTNGQQFGHTEGWSNATAINTAHAADFWFAYKVSNNGSDYLMELCNLAFNVYIGDDLNPVYTYFVAPDLGGDGCFHNYAPGEEHTFSARTQSHAIPLNLDEMKSIDLGAPVRVVLADYSYGTDKLFYSNARNAGVLVAIEDGVKDSDENIDMFLIPTWGDGDTMQDVIGRYFPYQLDSNGNYIAIWTPEYRMDTPTWCVEPRRNSLTTNQLWCKHALSTADWWNIYLNNLGDGSAQLQDTRAVPNSSALFRFNQDSDLDGYNDRTEQRLGTDPSNPASHPMQELIAGLHNTRVGSNVTTTLSLLNTGTYDAYSVKAVMVAPDDSISITGNSVGGTGRVRAQNSVVVGSLLKLADLSANWTLSGHSLPVSSGYYTGIDDRIYTFTALNSGYIATGTLQLAWDDGKGITGTLSYGAGYLSPSPLSVGAYGIKLGMISGNINPGDTFSMTAYAPIEAFSYHINREPYSEPLVVVSFNDPQGNHRFIVPPESTHLVKPEDNLMVYSGKMLKDPRVDIVTTSAISLSRSVISNTFNLYINNPTDVTITNAHLFVEFVDITGTVASEVPVTATLPPGPTLIPVTWSTEAFSPTYQATQKYNVMAFWTDLQGNIIDTSGRPLWSFQADPKPILATADADLLSNATSEEWRFGSVVAGETVKTRVGVANNGQLDLQLGSAVVTGVGLSAVYSTATTVTPATYGIIEVSLDTANLSAGPYSGVVRFNTNDVSHSSIVISVTGTIQNPQSGPVLLGNDPSRPWNERIYVPGGQLANSIVTYTSQVAPAQSTPLYLLDNAGSVVGRGLNVLQVTNTQLLRPASTYPNVFTPSNSLVQPSLRPMAPTALDNVVDDGDAGFSGSGGWGVVTSGWSPRGCGGYGGDARWTSSRIPPYTNDIDWVRWTPNIGQAGRYEVITIWPGIPNGKVDTEQAKYKIHSASGDYTVVKSQINYWCQWISLGTYEFSAGQGGYVQLADYTGDNPQKGITADAVLFRLQVPDTPYLNGVSNPDYDGNYTIDWTDTVGAAEGYTVQEWNGSSWYDIAYPGDSYLNISNHGSGDFCYRVIARNASGYGGWSNQFCWVNVRPPQGVPALSVIANSDYDGNFTVQWSDIPWTTQYYLQEKLNNGSYSEVYRGLGTSWSATNRGAGLWCYRAQAQNIRNTSDWSSEQCARVNTAPNLPVNLLPADGQAVFGRRLPLSWQDGGDPDNSPQPYRTYQAEIKTQSSTWQSTMPLSTTLAWNPVVPDDGLYTWRVQANDGALTSAWTGYSKLSVYSVKRASPSQISFALPQAVATGTRFEVQHGLPFSVASPGVVTTLYITVPKRIYTAATLDTIITTSISSVSVFQLDMGANGIDWSTIVPVGGGMLHSPDLSSGLNAYLASSGAAPGSPVRIPVTVMTLSQADGLLTNLYLNAGVDSDPLVQPNGISFNNPVPQESDLVTVTAQIGNSGYTATNVLVSFFAGDPKNKGTYIGSDFLPQVAYNVNVPARVSWFTGGITGTQQVYALIDIAGQITELNNLNNTLSTTLTILSRADLRPMAFTLSDEEPVVGELVTATVQVSNTGQTNAGIHTVSLYQGNPDNGGVMVGTSNQAGLAAGAGRKINFTWVPTHTGEMRLYTRLDKERQVNESDRTNNEAWHDVYVGLHGPIMMDSGSATETPFSSGLGYGYLDVGQPDQTDSCGTQPYETLRRDPGGRIVYRFDDMQPGRFYHLDVTYFECDGAGRQQYIDVDGNTVTGMENLSDGAVHRLSLRLDPALYADRSISVTIVAPGIDGAIVNEVNLHDVDYRYADAGGAADRQYSGVADGRIGAYGWLTDTVSASNNSWGSLPYQSVRISQGTNNNVVRYRFDGLRSAKQYQVQMTMWQLTSTARVHTVQIDGIDTGLNVNTGDYVLHQPVIDVPQGAYATDGSIVVSIVRTNGSTGAFVNEIALEERTVGVASVPAPVAAFSAAPLTGTVPLQVHFTDSSSGDVTSRLWAFGDGATDSAANPVHTYNTSGAYTVTLTVTGSGGSHSLTRSNTITVYQPVNANFSAVPTSGTSPLTATFTNQSTGSYASLLWNFGDGTTSTATNPSHTYATVGSYTVTLTASGVGGTGVLTKSQYINVTAVNQVVAGFTASPLSGVLPLTVTFTNQSTGNYSSLLWNFGDGTNSTATNPSHTYASVGSYTVTLTARGVGGTGVLTKSQYINVTAVNQVVAGFTASPLSGVLPLTVTFTNQSTGNYSSLLWNFGDGMNSTATNPSHTYTAAGVYTVSLTAYGANNTGVLTKSAYIVVQSPGAAVVWVSPSVQAAQLNTPITVSVQVTNITNFGAFEFALSFNPSLIEVQAISLGDFLGSTGRMIIPIGPVISNTAGTATIGAASLGMPSGADGGGRLVYVRVKPLAAGSAALHFNSGQLSTVNGTLIPFSMLDGQININQCQGDVDGDGDVDIIDVQLIAYRWGKKPPDSLYESRFDLDGDGDIDIVDIQMVAYRWGTSCNAGVNAKLSGPSDAPPTTFSTQLPDSLLVPGKVFTASVVISDVANMGSFEFTLGYNPSAVEVLGATMGGFPGSTGRTIFPLPLVISPTAGTVTYGAATLGDTPLGPDGNGILAVVQMRALTFGQSSLVFLNGQVSNIAGVPDVVSLLDTPLNVVALRYVYMPMAVR